jgi:phage baseplate assembly protein W
MFFHYPFKIDSRGHTAVANEEDHIRQLIEQVLFTIIGERVNRPTFGTTINQLVFAPNSDELATSTQFIVQGSLQQWLGELIQVLSVETKGQDSSLYVSIKYTIHKKDQQVQIAEFSREV